MKGTGEKMISSSPSAAIRRRPTDESASAITIKMTKMKVIQRRKRINEVAHENEPRLVPIVTVYLLNTRI